MYWSRGANLTMIGAIRVESWLTMGTAWQAVNADRFVEWVAHRLVPHLGGGETVVVDNLRAHKDARVRPLCPYGATKRPRLVS